MIGCHTDQLFNKKDGLSRFQKIAATYALYEREMTITWPWGGLLTVVAPEGLDAATLKVSTGYIVTLFILTLYLYSVIIVCIQDNAG